jgi:hypothetical protein
MMLAIVVYLALIVWVGWKIGGWVDRGIHPKKRLVNFHAASIPLSVNEWQRFSALATAKGCQTKTLMAEAIKFYLESKVK